MPGKTIDRELRLLDAPVGEPGSGMVRYAAAMYLNRRGLISDDLLEIYRVCARMDETDPRAVADHEGVAYPPELQR
jgi:hypothetical protein